MKIFSKKIKYLLLFCLFSCHTSDKYHGIDFGDIVFNDSAINVEVPKIIWTFWDKGEKAMPAFHKFNVNNMRIKFEPQGYKVVVVSLAEDDNNNLYKILGSGEFLPNFLGSLEDKAVYPTLKRMSIPVIQSDFARLALLEKFGGIWTDASNVFVKDMDYFVTPEFIKSPQSMAGYVLDGHASVGSQIVNGKRVDGFENWLIIAKTGSPIIRAWRRAFTEYWRTKKTLEPIESHEMYKDKGFDFGGLGPNDYLNQHVALKFVLWKKPDLSQDIFPLDFNPWWLHSRANGDIPAIATGPDHLNLAKQAMKDKVVLLKFASSHLQNIDKTFKVAEDFCRIPNFFADIYRLSIFPKSWCGTL